MYISVYSNRTKLPMGYLIDIHTMKAPYFCQMMETLFHPKNTSKVLFG